jgi:Polysaccharide pyruvyl transferase
MTEARWPAIEELLEPHADSNLAVFSYCGANLGDHVQSLALLQHVRLRKLVLRDHFRPHPELLLAANGWLTKGQIPTRQEFGDVKYLGIYLPPRLRTAEVAAKFQGLGTIGCRDHVTATFLEQHGIPVVLCRCATLSLPRYDGPREQIVCVDVAPAIVERVQRRYGPQFGDIITLTHHLPRPSPAEMTERLIRSQFERAHHFLSLYRAAALVVTNRIHVALPCLAFGTPVIVLSGKSDRYEIFAGTGVNWDAAGDLSWWRSWRKHAGAVPPKPDVEAHRQAYTAFVRETLNQPGLLRASPRPAQPVQSQAAAWA